MPEWLSGDVVANGVRIHYYRTGGDKPPLVLSHGATDSGRCWTRVARVLASKYDVILPDARGHGLSDAPPSGYASSNRVADLAGLIDALGLQRPAVGGHSMGAATTLRLISDYPDLACCAILEDPGFRSGEPSPPRPGQEDPRGGLRRLVLDAQAVAWKRPSPAGAQHHQPGLRKSSSPGRRPNYASAARSWTIRPALARLTSGVSCCRASGARFCW